MRRQFRTEVAFSEESGERRSWVFALPLGTHSAYDKDAREYYEFEVSEELAREICENSNTATANFEKYAPEGQTAYKFPVKKAHTDDGEHHGDLLEFKVAGEGEKRGIYVYVLWGPEIWAAIESKTIKYVSVGLRATYTDSEGVEYGPMIQEVSVTGEPRLKGIGTIQDNLNISLTEGGEGMTLEEALARIAELEQIIAELQEAQAEFAEGEEAEQEGAVVTEEAEDAVDDVVELIKKLAAEVETLRKEIKPDAPADEGLNLSERGGAGTIPRASGKKTADQRLRSAKAKGLTGLAAVKAGRNIRG